MSSTYKAKEFEFVELLNQLRPHLSNEAVIHVQHYVDHAELEMAFESFCLALDSESISIPTELKPRLYKLALELGLDTNSVFDADFWLRMAPMLKP